MQRENKNNKVILNERPAGFQNLPRKVVSQRQQQRQAWKIPYQVRDDRPLLNNGNGFTLIELLVVVLIIGILAAVALPQYQKAVDKSRYIQVETLGRHIAQAEELYYLANGQYTKNFEELDVSLSCTISNDKNICTYPWGKCTLDSQLMVCGDTVHLNNGFMYYFNNTENSWKGTRLCLSFSASRNDRYEKLCKTVGKSFAGIFSVSNFAGNGLAYRMD